MEASNMYLHQQKLDQQQQQHDEAIRLLKEELAATKEEMDTAWEHVTDNEREKRRMEAA